jgi:serine protease
MRRLFTAILCSLAIGAPMALPTNAIAGILSVPGAYSNIQAALNAAANGDVILVGPGVYTQNLTFGSKQVALRSTAGPSSTIIHVAGGVGVQLGGNSELTGFTITGAVSDFGAGVVVSGTGTLIKGNVFDGNVETSGGFGAAIGGNGASPIIDGNLFRNNSSDFQFLSGVVAFVNSSSPVIENNIFEDNLSRAINFTLPEDSRPKVINNTFVRNTVAVRVDRRVV